MPSILVAGLFDFGVSGSLGSAQEPLLEDYTTFAVPSEEAIQAFDGLARYENQPSELRTVSITVSFALSGSTGVSITFRSELTGLSS